MNDFGMSGDDLEQMYQEVILEASKHPHGRESFAYSGWIWRLENCDSVDLRISR